MQMFMLIFAVLLRRRGRREKLLAGEVLELLTRGCCWHLVTAAARVRLW